MTKLMLNTLGYVFLILGIIGMLTPVPLELLFLVLSLLLLIPTSPMVTRGVRQLRKRSVRVDRGLATLIRKLPSPYRRILRQTDVDPLGRTQGW